MILFLRKTDRELIILMEFLINYKKEVNKKIDFRPKFAYLDSFPDIITPTRSPAPVG